MGSTEVMDVVPDTTSKAKEEQPDAAKQLSRYLDTKYYFETLLLDMLRADQLHQNEYDKMMSEHHAAYAQFRKDLEQQTHHT